MHRLRTTRALRRATIGWTVLLAVLFGLFTPALSQAVALAAAGAGAQTAPAYLAEICSATGTRHVMVFDDAGGSDAPAVPDMSHCDLCCSHHPAALAPPPQPEPVLALDRERDPYPPLFYHAPGTQHAWTPAQSRGPPSSLS